MYTEVDGLTSSLFLREVREQDSGFYSCKVGSSSSAVILLTVILGITFPDLEPVQKCSLEQRCTIR